MRLNDRELKTIIGGSITATFINAIVKGFELIIEIGRSLGSSIRRVASGKSCSV